MKKYKIDLNNKYELHVEKKCASSLLGNDLYISVLVTIKRKDDNFYLILNDVIYEHKWLSKIIGTWEERAEKAERKLIKKAKKTIDVIPAL